MTKNTESQPQRRYPKIILVSMAVAGLLLTLVPSFLNWQGITGPQQVNSLMFYGAVLWFVSAGFLFGTKKI